MAKYVDIDAVKEAVRKAECDANWDGRIFDAEFIENALDFIPAADVAPVRQGHWIKDNDSFQTDDYYCCYFDYNCSECGEIVNDRHKLPNYCPNCGAKMDEETEDK
jgi:rubrerythrin